MQLLTVPPRSALTGAQVTALIRDAPGLVVAAGCELVDQALSVLEDITERLAGGSVTRQSYATLHGTAQLAVEGELEWGAALVRPYMVLTAGAVSARFNLGVYFTSTPLTELGPAPVIYDVTCYDILDGLNTPVGDSYAVESSAFVLATVETILVGQGFTRYVIDPAASGRLLPSARVWVLDEDVTWLGVVNDLLGSVGYAGLWSDWDGVLRAAPYAPPSQRSSEWTYDTGELTSQLTPQRTAELDLYRAPNRWVAYRANFVDGPTPVEGAGKYTVVNQSSGPTSVDARRGRVITRVVPLDAADQAGLVAAAQSVIDADLRLTVRLNVGTAPNPLHWHFDRITVDDPELGPFGSEMLVASWTLPLDGADMSHEWTSVRSVW
jgi:hypothetical protein